MANPLPMQPGCSYHIYNRGINGENLFREERNYGYFLHLYTLHILPVADTFAYCLLRNHFHLLIKVKETASDSKTEHGGLSPISQGFANLFKAYTAAINKTYQRTGGLFERPFHRQHIASDAYFTRVIAYIHLNPQKHGFVKEFSEWPHSSYATLMS